MILIGEIIIFIGTLFILLSAIGIGKMPNFLMRLQTASKASAFGTILILIGANFIAQSTMILINSFILCLFLIISTPIGAHAMAQADKRRRMKKTQSTNA